MQRDVIKVRSADRAHGQGSFAEGGRRSDGSGRMMRWAVTDIL